MLFSFFRVALGLCSSFFEVWFGMGWYGMGLDGMGWDGACFIWGGFDFEDCS